MYCSKCGTKNSADSKFCISCGQKLTPGTLTEKLQVSGWSRKKAWFWIVVFITLTSLFWGGVYSSSDDQAVNIMSKLFETVGRQAVAWTKAEEVTNEFGYALSDECIYTPGCVDESVSKIATLRAEINKETEEIDRIWSESVVGTDFEDYFSGLTERNQNTLLDVFNIYFPEESQELEGIPTDLL